MTQSKRSENEKVEVAQADWQMDIQDFKENGCLINGD
jgi:hypothetical protein